MKTVSSIKSNAKCESPKTPGGISKAFLTPVRRVGLSKNWRRSGPSPFVSPLTKDSSAPTTQADVENKPTKKRGRVLKTEVDIHEDDDKIPGKDSENAIDNAEDLEPLSISEIEQCAEIVTTPLRNIQLSHKSKSKSAISVKVCKNKITDNPVPSGNNDTTLELSENLTEKPKVLAEKDNIKPDTKTNSDKVEEAVSKPVRKKSVKKNVKPSPQKTHIVKTPASDEKSQKIYTDSTVLNTANTEGSKPAKRGDCESTTPKSPNELTKECIVVIQRKINKGIEKATKPDKPVENFVDIAKPKVNLASQALFDSDSDDAPLSTINKKNCDETKNTTTSMKRPRQLDLDEDDDFCENKKIPPKIKKLEDKSTSSGDLKLKSERDAMNNKQIKQKPTVNAQRIINVERSSHDSNSFDVDDDDFEVKRTILIRKTYNKYHVVKPHKARSTGSVTKKDIEDLKARIEMKKNLLLAKTICPDTEDLRNLTKKWKKGCQDALQELMELMKTKFPDKQGMGYSEMLQLLQIPSSLVGYNSEDDCFTSPDDAGIILSKFNLANL